VGSLWAIHVVEEVASSLRLMPELLGARWVCAG